MEEEGGPGEAGDEGREEEVVSPPEVPLVVPEAERDRPRRRVPIAGDVQNHAVGVDRGPVVDAQEHELWAELPISVLLNEIRSSYSS